MQGSWDGSVDEEIPRATGMIEMAPQTVEEQILIRKVVIEKEGLIVSVFDVLRRIPRRILMILKLNDLTRHVKQPVITCSCADMMYILSAGVLIML